MVLLGTVKKSQSSGEYFRKSRLRKARHPSPSRSAERESSPDKSAQSSRVEERARDDAGSKSANIFGGMDIEAVKASATGSKPINLDLV